MSAELDLMPLFKEAVENLGEWIETPVPDSDATLASDMVALAIDYGFDADTVTGDDGETWLRVKTDDAAVRFFRLIVGDFMRSADYDGTDFATGDATTGWNVEGDGIEAANMRARGRFETQATGQRVVMDDDSVDFYSGHADERSPGNLTSFASGDNGWTQLLAPVMGTLPGPVLGVGRGYVNLFGGQADNSDVGGAVIGDNHSTSLSLGGGVGEDNVRLHAGEFQVESSASGVGPAVLVESAYTVGVGTTPPAPDNGIATIFVRTSGGKEELCVRFHTGLTQVIASEP